MLSLEKTSGLPIEMREDYSLTFAGSLSVLEPEIRDFSAMKNYLKDPFAKYWRREVYRVYRQVCQLADREKIEAAEVEYDLTIMPPGKIGEEFAKTIGHYHPYKSGTEVRYPEVYEVVFGKAFFLLQSASADLERLQEVILISAARGEKVVIPPGFGHVTINPTEDVLIVANWQVSGNSGIYEPFENTNGAAYYVAESQRLTKSGHTSSNFEFMPNLNYKSVPELNYAEARELPQYNLLSAVPMYLTGAKNLETLDFLVNPENHLDELIPAKLFIRQDRSKI